MSLDDILAVLVNVTFVICKKYISKQFFKISLC